LRVPQNTKTTVLAGLDTIPPERRASWRIHRVAEGDTIELIAKRYNMSVASIVAANNTPESDIGDVLIIPTSTELERMNAAKTKKTSASSKAKGAARKATVRNARGSRPASPKPAQRKIASSGVHVRSFR
jgi:membrane-bound lytic murein transglycosylase D